MGIIQTIKRWIGMLFSSRAKEEFDIEPITSDVTQKVIEKCSRIYQGAPDWVDENEHIKTVNFARTICKETAKLSTLNIKINIDGGQRAEDIQKSVNKAILQLRNWVEYACAFGTVILKPNGDTIDMYTPGRFIVTDCKNGEITGVVFYHSEKAESGGKYYTRLEYHHILNDGTYEIKNVCYIGNSQNDMSKKIPIEQTPWSGLAEYSRAENVDRPLYGTLKMPGANCVEIDSPLSLPVFFDAIEEFKDIDIAYSRFAKENKDSKRTVLLDSDRLIPSGTSISNTLTGFERVKEKMRLPDIVKNVYGNGKETFYEEINPTLNTDTRVAGLNALIGQAGYKCGFSNGYFVFNEKTGMVTATEVHANQSRTIQTMDDVRTEISKCMYDVIYALNVFEDSNTLTPREELSETIFTDEETRKIHIHFGPIYVNAAEDRQRALTLTLQNFYPKQYYLHMYEGLSEKDADALVKQAEPKEMKMYEDEE